MEKIATIDVFLDTLNDGSSKSRFNEESKYGEVILTATNSINPIRSKDDLADVFAHEMGHIIGRVLRLPTQTDALRDTVMVNFGFPVTDAVYHAEEQAWDLAGKMRKVNPRIKEPRLKGYRDGMEK